MYSSQVSYQRKQAIPGNFVQSVLTNRKTSVSDPGRDCPNVDPTLEKSLDPEFEPY